MHDYPKAIRKLIREYEAQAYERELHQELEKLDRSFAEWAVGQPAGPASWHPSLSCHALWFQPRYGLQYVQRRVWP